MEKYEKIVLRKDSGKLTLNGYHHHRASPVRTFDVLCEVQFGLNAMLWLIGGDNWISNVCVGSWAGVSSFLEQQYGVPLYGMHKADAQVMEILKEREKMMDHALMEYVLPKGQRKGFPPGKLDGRMVKEVESFRDWKARQDHWASMQEKNVASPS